MCCGGTYLDTTTNKLIKVYFPVPNVLIPIIDQDGVCKICQWGQREQDKNLIKELPITGWARIESLEKPFWTKHNPKKVSVSFKSFFEKDRNDPLYPKNKATEFALTDKKVLQGLLIEHPVKNIVYIITMNIDSWIHDRHPVLVDGG